MGPEQSHSEDVLDGRLVVHVYESSRRGTLISIGSIANQSGSMNLTPLELAALLGGPLERALAKANRSR